MFRSNRAISRAAIGTLELGQRVRVAAAIIDARATAAAPDALTPDAPLGEVGRFAAAHPWRRAMFAYLAPLDGKVVLDLGCGYAASPLVLARAGATVHACDAGPGALARLARMAGTPGLADRLAVHCAPAEALPFADGTFDAVFGSAVRHHPDLGLAAPEIARALKPGGKGVFCDPLGHNRVLEFARDYLPYRGKHAAKGTDLPLRVADIARFGGHFAAWEHEGGGLADLAARLAGPRRGRVQGALARAERALLRTLPPAQRYAPYAVIRVRKEPRPGRETPSRRAWGGVRGLE